MEYLIITTLAFVQNVSFTITSRSRNRDNTTYHILASIFSNGLWFLTMRELVKSDLTLQLLPFYIGGTVIGSVTGAKVSMWIERIIGASSDGHLKKG